MELNKKSFKRMFPNLANVIESDESRVDITSVRTDDHSGERAASTRFAYYVPDVIDFIRRCDTETQAEEIISYMEKQGEIGREYGQRLMQQLRKKGVRGFGPKKEEGYYLKHGER
jgi:hypothetical protein